MATQQGCVPPEDGVSGLEDCVVDDEVVGGEGSDQLLRAKKRDLVSLALLGWKGCVAHIDQTLPLVWEVSLRHD